MIKNISNLGDAALYCDFGSEVNKEINSEQELVKNYTPFTDLKNYEIDIINDGGYVTLERVFNIKKTNSKNPKFIIILNFESKNDENIFDFKNDLLKNYKIKYRYDNCFLMEIND